MNREVSSLTPIYSATLSNSQFPNFEQQRSSSGTFVEQACALAIDVEITTRLSDLPGFQVIPRRWVSERTFAWLGNYRRLSKDYEYWVYTSDATIYAVMVHIMVRRLARLQTAD